MAGIRIDELHCSTVPPLPLPHRFSTGRQRQEKRRADVQRGIDFVHYMSTVDASDITPRNRILPSILPQQQRVEDSTDRTKRSHDVDVMTNDEHDKLISEMSRKLAVDYPEKPDRTYKLEAEVSLHKTRALQKRFPLLDPTVNCKYASVLNRSFLSTPRPTRTIQIGSIHDSRIVRLSFHASSKIRLKKTDDGHFKDKDWQTGPDRLYVVKDPVSELRTEAHRNAQLRKHGREKTDLLLSKLQL